MDIQERLEETTNEMVEASKEFATIMLLNADRLPGEVALSLQKAFTKYQLATSNSLEILSIIRESAVRTEVLNATGDYEEEMEGELQ